MNRIRVIRKHKKWSQAQLANILNVDQTAVSNWENGRNSIDIDIARKIALEVNVPLEYVYGYESFGPSSFLSWQESINTSFFAGKLKDYKRLKEIIQSL